MMNLLAINPKQTHSESHGEPEHTTYQYGSALKRIHQEVAEKLDYAPGVFSVDRHVRGK